MAIKYEIIRPTLKTGDVVLFSGKGWISLIIKWFCTLSKIKKSRWQHIGAVMRYKNRIMLFESTMHRKDKKGVQINFLSGIIKNHKGKVAIRQLFIDEPLLTRDILQEKTEKFVEDNLGKPYETDLLELAGAAYDGIILGHNKPDESTVFCSELIANLYTELGLLKSASPNEFTPDDFGYNQHADKLLKLTGKAHLGFENEII